jgi:hypothetical protein
LPQQGPASQPQAQVQEGQSQQQQLASSGILLLVMGQLLEGEG